MNFSYLSTVDQDNLNCKKFDIDPLQDAAALNQFVENTFRCLECNEHNNIDLHKDFYYDRATAECKARTPVLNCKIHAREKNVCQECMDNFVLKNNVCEALVIADANLLPKNFGYI